MLPHVPSFLLAFGLPFQMAQTKLYHWSCKEVPFLRPVNTVVILVCWLSKPVNSATPGRVELERSNDATLGAGRGVDP